MHAADVTRPEDVAARLSPVLRQFAGTLLSARKRMAVWCGRHPSMVKDYVEGKRQPKLSEFVDLAVQCPALADELMAMINERRQQRHVNAKPANHS